MPTDRSLRRARPVLAACLAACLAAALLLGGCADDGSPGPATPAPSAGAGSEARDGSAAGTETGGASTKGEAGSSGARTDGTTGAEPETEPDNGGGADPSGAVLEVPVAAEPTVDSLGELLGDTARPLVTSPLPRAASARGRLVGGFPAVLRPTRGSQVESSSVSPADGRLQVALVGSTALTPARLLLSYRTRLARRGLTEQATPATSADSQAASLTRGRSTVTITATRRGSRTTYSVMASLHTGRE